MLFLKMKKKVSFLTIIKSEKQSCVFEIKQLSFKMKRVMFFQWEQWAIIVVSEEF